MTATTLDQFMLDHAPAAPLPVDERLISARRSITAALGSLSSIPDSALELPWRWGGQELDIRYGFYRQYEALEGVRAQLASGLAGAIAGQPTGRPLAAAATAARWNMHGLLAGLTDEILDADPANGEWTLRQTLAHIVSGQRDYGWFTAWWLSRRDLPAADVPAKVPDDVGTELPDEVTEGLGSLREIQERLDAILDLSAGVVAPLGAAELGAPARWSAVAVDVRFRVVRWSSHLREHTIQLEKTLAMVGHQISEVERLVRLIGAAWGRLEADLYMWPPGAPGVDDALAVCESIAVALAAEVAGVRDQAQQA